MPKDYTECTEKEIVELIAKAHGVPVENVKLSHYAGDDDLRGSSPPSVSARVLVKKS